MSATELSAWDAQANEQVLLARCEALCERARAAGADDVEAFASGGEQVSVAIEKGDLNLVHVDEGASVGLRVLIGGRQGFSSTNQLADVSLGTLVEDALALARLAPEDEHAGLVAAAPAAPSLELVQPDVAAYGVEEAVPAAQELAERALGRDPRLSLDKAELGVMRTSVAVASSRGVRSAESDAQITMSVFGMAIDGDDVGGFDYWGQCVRSTAELEAAMEETAARFADGALGNLGAGAGRGYRGPVLFAPAAFQAVFVSPLVSAASALAVQRGRSALAGKLGQPIAAPGLTIEDDPTDRGLAGACTFDREGTPARRFAIVEAGSLAGLLYNGYAARVDGVSSSGHASGGARAVPGLGPHALVVAPGDGGTPADLYGTLGEGLVVQRFSGTVDPASGDFSGVAKSARWIEPGGALRPVRETLISGNAFELLTGALSLGGTAESLMGGARAPWALVDGVSVTAG